MQRLLRGCLALRFYRKNSAKDAVPPNPQPLSARRSGEEMRGPRGVACGLGFANQGFRTIPGPSVWHRADRDHVLAAGDERNVVDPLLPDLVGAENLAGVGEHDDIGIAKDRK